MSDLEGKKLDTTLQVRFPATLSEIFGQAELELLNQVAENVNFTIQPHPSSEKDDGPCFMTDMKRRIIYVDTKAKEKMAPFRLFACMAHEMGHHHPEVVPYMKQCELAAELLVNTLPDGFPDQMRKQFLHSWINIQLDVLLESIVPKYITTGNLFSQVFRQNRGLIFLEVSKASQERLDQFDKTQRTEYPWAKEDFDGQPGFNQYQYLYLVAPFFNNFPDPNMVRPSVAKLFPRLQKQFTLLRTKGLPANARIQAFYECIEDLRSLHQEYLDELSAEEIESFKLKDIILEKIRQSIADATAMTEVSDTLDDPNEQEDSEKEGIEKIDGMRRKMNESLNQTFGNHGSILNDIDSAKAYALGVSPEDYRDFLDTRERYLAEIKVLTSVLAEFLLQEYKKQMLPHRKQGHMIMPGREVETYQRVLSGDDNPPTRIDRKLLRNPKKLELWKLIDVSGSMGTILAETLGMYTIITQSGVNIAEELSKNSAQYNIRDLQYPPLKLGVIGFDNDLYEIVTPNDKIDEGIMVRGFAALRNLSISGGGTDDLKALRYTHSKMKTADRSTLKMISMISDGGGVGGDALLPILRQIEDDNSIYFLAQGVGNGAHYIVENYKKKFRPAYFYHVYARESTSVNEAITFMVSWLKEQIQNFSAKA